MTEPQPEALVITVQLQGLGRDSGGELTHEDYGRVMDHIDLFLGAMEERALELAVEQLGMEALTGETRSSWKMVGDTTLEVEVAVRLRKE